MRQTIEETGNYKGFPYLVIAYTAGHRCGYVGLDKDHPLYEVEYAEKTEDRDSPECLFDVHGGLTFSSHFDNQKTPEIDQSLWWFGFDCAHLYDAKDPSIMSDEYLEIENKYELSIPGGTIKTTEYVREECKSLIDQIITMETE